MGKKEKLTNTQNKNNDYINVLFCFFVVYGQDTKHKSGRLHPLGRSCVQKQTSAPPVWTGGECKQIVDTFRRTNQTTSGQNTKQVMGTFFRTDRKTNFHVNLGHL